MGGGDSSPSGGNTDGFSEKASPAATSPGNSQGASSSSSSSGSTSSSNASNVTDGDVSEVVCTALTTVAVNPKHPLLNVTNT